MHIYVTIAPRRPACYSAKVGMCICTRTCTAEAMHTVMRGVEHKIIHAGGGRGSARGDRVPPHAVTAPPPRGNRTRLPRPRTNHSDT